MIIPMLCVTIFVILVVWFLLPRVARLMIHTPTAISIFVCLSMVQLMAVFISMRCTLCGHFLQVALTLILVVGYAIAASYMAVGFYVAKYVNKKSDMDLAAKGLGAKEWNNSLKTKLSLLPKKLFRIRMSRNFGMKMLTMTNLSTECLIQLTKLGYDATPFNQILKQNAKREMRLRLGKVTVADVLAAQPVTTNLLKFMRASIKMIGVSNLQSFIASMTQKLTLSDISDESKNYLDKAGITTACLRIEEKWLNMLGTFVKDWFRYESHFVHGRDSLVDILKERGLLSESDAVQSLIGKKS